MIDAMFGLGGRAPNLGSQKALCQICGDVHSPLWIFYALSEFVFYKIYIRIHFTYMHCILIPT